MARHALTSPQAAGAIWEHANNLIDSGRLEHIPFGPERAEAAIELAAKETYGATTTLRVLGNRTMSDQTRAMMQAIGKDPGTYGHGGSWRRVTCL